MNYDDAKRLIRQHEGYRSKVYLDTKGIPTCGYGHALHVGSHIPFSVAERFFELDFFRAIEDYDRFENTFSISLNGIRRAVMLNMFFNMGWRKVCG